MLFDVLGLVSGWSVGWLLCWSGIAKRTVAGCEQRLVGGCQLVLFAAAAAQHNTSAHTSSVCEQQTTQQAGHCGRPMTQQAGRLSMHTM